MYGELRMKARQTQETRKASARSGNGRSLAALGLACALGIVGGTAVLADDGGVSVQTRPATAMSAPTVNDANFWVGRNISAVVKVFGQPTYWNANHEGGGGGNRYIYSNPNQPHFVFETAPGQMIVKAVRIP